jgi:flap endonuclease-1
LGVNLTPIIVKNRIRLRDLRGKSLAVDANNVLHQFLALIRSGTTLPLMGPDGSVTSHLVGLLYRTTHLISRYHLTLVFVFDGKPHPLKMREIEKRRRLREKAITEWREALEKRDYHTAFSKAVMTGRLTSEMVEDAKTLLGLLGIPRIQAPADAEAQAAHIAKRRDVWASSSRDYDSLLFGAPRLVRYLTISGREFLPSKGVSRPLEPELIVLDEFLSSVGLTREQLIDLAILIGTDFNEGIRGIGPKTALRLLKRYGKIENLPADVRGKIDPRYQEVRKIFLHPQVTEDYTIGYGSIEEDEVYEFLCVKKGFSKPRVKRAIERLKSAQKEMRQAGLEMWMRK